MLLIAMVSRDILVACGSLIEVNPDARNLKRRLGQPRRGCLSGGNDSTCSLTFNNTCNLFTAETSFFTTETRVSLALQHYLKDTYTDHGGPNIRIQHLE
jgi:hypothetical protein